MEHFEAYLAGVLDSDGSISIIKRLRQTTTRGYHYRELVQISWKKDDGTVNLANFLKKRYGGSVYVSSTNRSWGDTTVVKYMAEGKIAERLLRRVEPFMILKREQAILALRMRELKSNNWGKGHPKPDTVWQEEDEIYSKVLKQRARGRTWSTSLPVSI